jgi:hypothetical protein
MAGRRSPAGPDTEMKTPLANPCDTRAIMANEFHIPMNFPGGPIGHGSILLLSFSRRSPAATKGGGERDETGRAIESVRPAGKMMQSGSSTCCVQFSAELQWL